MEQKKSHSSIMLSNRSKMALSTDAPVIVRKKYPLILIEWEDSSLGFQGWKIIDDQSTEMTTFISVGFLTYEDKKCVILYPHIDVDLKNRNPAGAGDITIPCSAIRKRRILKY